MRSKPRKYYVVLKGHITWIFTDRNECKRQIEGFLWAVYKSFETRECAQYARQEQSFWYKWQSSSQYLRTLMEENFESSICTDAACPSNPWPVEYRGVIISSWIEIFNYGPLEWWSVNIAEFLAIVKWLKRIQAHNNNHSNNNKYTTLYSDSTIAIWWVQKWAINTTISATLQNQKLFSEVHNATDRLKQYPDRFKYTTIIKRPTRKRGQIPADFGRK
jgi:ribonuclease HI